MKLGANSVLFGGYDMATAFKYIKMSGYDGIEISAIGGMSEHLVLDKWQEIAPQIKQLAADYELELLAMEQPRRDPVLMEAAMQAAVESGIPIINCGPGGKTERLALDERPQRRPRRVREQGRQGEHPQHRARPSRKGLWRG